jgi:threonine dehydrogenase-like Zn-dependent dehydrogenase
VVAERGADGIAKVLDLTGGDGTHVVVEAVGHRPAYDMAVDAEYARKYQGSTAAIAHITSPLARTTTMRVEPR